MPNEYSLQEGKGGGSEGGKKNKLLHENHTEDGREAPATSPPAPCLSFPIEHRGKTSLRLRLEMKAEGQLSNFSQLLWARCYTHERDECN